MEGVVLGIVAVETVLAVGEASDRECEGHLGHSSKPEAAYVYRQCSVRMLAEAS